jgi:hypothetical protein
MESGYLHANYARSFAALGTPYYLPEAQGWILKRSIPDSASADAMGCYPIFVCRHWRKLAPDIARLADELVSLTLVTDPLGAFAVTDLCPAFSDLLRPYKEHFIVDLKRFSHLPSNAHHRRNVRQALAQVQVEPCAPATALQDWVRLYEQLIQRHHITGIAAFSQESFALQWQTPGLAILRATCDNETVGMTLWFQDEERVYYHLAAYSPRGYECKASYALFHYAIEHFARAGMRWMALGAGTHNDGSDGLTRFKRGWATETRTAYLCGRIFQPQTYAALVKAQATTSFFPAYRHPAITPTLTPYFARSYAA